MAQFKITDVQSLIILWRESSVGRLIFFFLLKDKKCINSIKVYKLLFKVCYSYAVRDRLN